MVSTQLARPELDVGGSMTTYSYPVVLNDSDVARLNTGTDFFIDDYEFSNGQHREIWRDSLRVIFSKIHGNPEMMSTYQN